MDRRSFLQFSAGIAGLSLPSVSLPAEPAVSAIKYAIRVNAPDSETIASIGKRGWPSYVRANLFRSEPSAELPPFLKEWQKSIPSPEQAFNKLWADQDILKNSSDEQKEQLRKKNRESEQELFQGAMLARLYRQTFSTNPIRELVTQFWLNHFNVFRDKGPAKLFIPHWEWGIQAKALGSFQDLLFFTLMHPLMMYYLDNHQNRATKLNENYARELLELHTLGIKGGYSQQDIQELAKILTGSGISRQNKLRIPDNLAGFILEKDGFLFDPSGHDLTDKKLLGKAVKGQPDFDEIAKVIIQLANHPSTASHIAHKLCVWLVSDTPSDTLVRNATQTFKLSNGNIAKTVESILLSREFSSQVKFKLPEEYAVSCLRIIRPYVHLKNLKPVMDRVASMDQPFYGRATPDGWPPLEKYWASPDQLQKRFATAKDFSYSSRLFFTEDEWQLMKDKPEFKKDREAQSFLENKLDYEVIHNQFMPILSDTTLAVLSKAKTAGEWFSLLLSSPEFMYR